jgi:hypothetical protein
MAATPKFGAEDAKKIEQDIVQAVEVSGADAVAAAIGKPVKFVQGLLEKGLSTKAGQQLVKGVQDLDKKLLDLRVKPPVTGETPPPAFPGTKQEIPTQMDGSMGPGRGGPVVPTQRRGALMPLPQNVEAEDIPPPAGSLARVQQRVQEAQPIEPVKQLPPPGRREETLRESLQEGQPGMEQLPEYNLGIGPSKRTMAKAALGVTGAGAAAAGYKLLGDKPLATQEGVGDTTRVAEVTATPDIKAMTDKAMPHVPEQAKEIIQNQVQKVLSLEERLNNELSDARTKYNKEVARKEMLQAIETVMHGLVTALGAKAALDRGSPFAIDFSKGPQVNWESKFANLQKDFELQTNAIVKKYDLEQKERLEQQKAEESKRRYEERMGLEREKLGVEKTKVEQQLAKQQAEDVAKLNAEQQKQYNTNLKHYGDLRRAIAEKKPGPVQDAATLLGASDDTTAKLTEAMNQGMWDKILTMLGISEQPTTEQILQGLRPQKPAPAAAPAAPAAPAQQSAQPVQLPSALVITDDKGNVIERKTRPPNITDEKWKAYVDSVSAQNKNIGKEF